MLRMLAILALLASAAVASEDELDAYIERCLGNGDTARLAVAYELHGLIDLNNGMLDLPASHTCSLDTQAVREQVVAIANRRAFQAGEHWAAGRREAAIEVLAEAASLHQPVIENLPGPLTEALRARLMTLEVGQAEDATLRRGLVALDAFTGESRRLVRRASLCRALRRRSEGHEAWIADEFAYLLMRDPFVEVILKAKDL